ncbi:hypothetical protein BVRB_1g003480 [Beta vulgaris subsp. vulgaris]|nr:hypothetical protein BVRB_1g003480 [Beta vulgaris subsp. vulgaris]
MVKIWDCGSPLYDSYELASLSHLIERHLMIIPSLGGSKRFKYHQYHQNNASTAVIASKISMKSSEASKGSYMVFNGGCIGSCFMWREMRQERIMKIKFKIVRLLGIKWFK